MAHYISSSSSSSSSRRPAVAEKADRTAFVYRAGIKLSHFRLYSVMPSTSPLNYIAISNQ